MQIRCRHHTHTVPFMIMAGLDTQIKSGGKGGRGLKLVQCSNHIFYFVVLEYEYVGCFVDHWSRVLDGEAYTDQTKLSANICNRLCNSEKQSFKYFGTEVIYNIFIY